MTTTNIIKWNDTANQLTAYCDDDPAETELGPAKWDDANNVLEIHCDGNEYQVKWNDDDNRLEARSVDCGCDEYTNDCPTCYSTDQTPRFIEATGSDIENCYEGSIDCTYFNNTFVLEVAGCSYTKEVGDRRIILDLDHNPTWMWAYEWYALYRGQCYSAETSGNCDDDETNLPNSLASGDCSGINSPHVYGYGGYFTWAPL